MTILHDLKNPLTQGAQCSKVSQTGVGTGIVYPFHQHAKDLSACTESRKNEHVVSACNRYCVRCRFFVGLSSRSHIVTHRSHRSRIIVGHPSRPCDNLRQWFTTIPIFNRPESNSAPVAIPDPKIRPMAVLCLFPQVLVEPSHGGAHDSPRQMLVGKRVHVDITALIQVVKERVEGLRDLAISRCGKLGVDEVPGRVEKSPLDVGGKTTTGVYYKTDRCSAIRDGEFKGCDAVAVRVATIVLTAGAAVVLAAAVAAFDGGPEE